MPATKARSKSKKAAPRRAGKTTALRGADPRRVRKILEGLDQAYPAATCALNHKDAFQLLVATILSAQCTDARVNQVTPELFRKYPTPEHLAHAVPGELEQEIRSTGFFRNKAKSLIGASRKIVEQFGGQVPRTMDEILQLPGVARKTANVVLGTAYGIASGVVVDTHVQRVARRLDLAKSADPKKIEQELMKALPQDRWILFSHQMIWHGRRVCQARHPKCNECILEPLCYSRDKTYAGS
jgi:endonuclease-3